jgi:hypothetical protein
LRTDVELPSVCRLKGAEARLVTDQMARTRLDAVRSEEEPLDECVVGAWDAYSSCS